MKIIYKDGHVDECPQDQELHVIRHTAAHIMAQAIKRLYPEADFAFGPATENGFYYDVDLGDTKLTDDDLANIEKEMRKICKENLAIKPFILPRDEAVKLAVRPRRRCRQGLTNPLPGMSCHSFRCRATSLPYSVTRFQSSGVTVSVKDLRSQGPRARDDAGHFVCDEFVAL